MIIAVTQKGEPMEWIVEAESLSEFIDHGRYTLSTKPLIRCKDCKHFELDHFEKVEGFPVPIIVAHEICMKWSDGCRTSKDGWCFMAERRTDERLRHLPSRHLGL